MSEFPNVGTSSTTIYTESHGVVCAKDVRQIISPTMKTKPNIRLILSPFCPSEITANVAISDVCPIYLYWIQKVNLASKLSKSA